MPSHGGRITKDNPQPPRAISKHLKREERTPAKSPRNTKSLDNQAVGIGQYKGRRVPPKEGRNSGRPTAYQPKSEPTPKEETQARNTRRRECARGQGYSTAEQRPHKSPTHMSSRRGHLHVTNHPNARAGEGQTETRKGGLTSKCSRDYRLPQRTGAVDTTGQQRTHPKARESNQGTAQPAQKARTAGGDDRTTWLTNQVPEASRAKKALLNCRPKELKT